MPEKIIQGLTGFGEAVVHAVIFAVVGVLIGLGQLLNSREDVTPRLIFGRCLSTAGISMAAGAVLLVFPGIPLVAMIGVAAALGNLGTAGLERVIQRIFGAKEA